MKEGDYVRRINCADVGMRLGQVCRIDAINERDNPVVKGRSYFAENFEPVKVAVHCKTEDEWNRVRERVGTHYTPKWSGAKAYGYTGVCIDMDGRWDDIESAREDGHHIISAQEYLGEELTAATTGDEITITINQSEGEDKMEISNNIFEVFDKEDMKKIQARFGTQYGNTDRDLLALRHDKDSLLKIIKEEEEAAKKEAEKD